MTNRRVLVVVGSLRRESFNRRLAVALTAMAPPHLSFVSAEIGALPLFNQDDEQHPPAAVTRLRSDLSAANALLFVTPEYNRSIPGVLKNALDHGSRPYRQNAWAGKPAGVIGASSGQFATAMAQQHLRNVLAYLDVLAMGQPEAYVRITEGFYDADGRIVPDDRRAFLQRWVDAYAAFVDAQLR